MRNLFPLTITAIALGSGCGFGILEQLGIALPVPGQSPDGGELADVSITIPVELQLDQIRHARTHRGLTAGSGSWYLVARVELSNQGTRPLPLQVNQFVLGVESGLTVPAAAELASCPKSQRVDEDTTFSCEMGWVLDETDRPILISFKNDFASDVFVIDELPTCPDLEHRCDGRCVDDDDIATCGDRCTPCPAPENGHATCDGVRCGENCDPGTRACGGACALCPATGVQATGCQGALCVATACQAGYGLEDGACAQVWTLAQIGQASVEPHLAVAPDGRWHVAYDRWDSGVMYNDNGSTSTLDMQSLAGIAVDASGGVHFLENDTYGLNYWGPGVDTVQVQDSSMADDAAFVVTAAGTPHMVYTKSSIIRPFHSYLAADGWHRTQLEPTVTTYRMRLAIGDNDHLAALFEENSNFSLATYSGSDWSYSSGYGFMEVIAVRSDGGVVRAHAYEGGVTINEAGTPSSVSLADEPYWVAIAIGPDDRTHLVYSAIGGGVGYVARQAGHWSVEPISDHDACGTPDIDVAADGTVHIVYTRNEYPGATGGPVMHAVRD